MGPHRLTALRAGLVAAALVAVVPAAAQAGTVTKDGDTIVFQATPDSDHVDVGFDGQLFVSAPGVMPVTQAAPRSRRTGWTAHPAPASA